jgi:hypothetical protein
LYTEIKKGAYAARILKYWRYPIIVRMRFPENNENTPLLLGEGLG